MEQGVLQRINIHSLLDKFKSKKELYRFLQQDCKAFLPKISSANVYFFKQILNGEKEYLRREDVKVSAIPHIEGLSVQDFLNYAREKSDLLHYLPDERDWVHLERQWICDVLFSLDTENIQNMVNEALILRQKKLEDQQNLAISIRPEFAQALEQCIQFSHDKGRSVFLLKDSSKRKRTRQEIEEVKGEENIFKEDKQRFLREYKRLKNDKQELQIQLQQQNNNQEIINQLIDAGILNQNGDFIIQQQFEI